MLRRVFDDLGVTGEEVQALAAELRDECAKEAAARCEQVSIGCIDSPFVPGILGVDNEK
jgi:hypothetical protein